MRLRRWGIVAALVACALGIVHRYVLPELVALELRRELHARGFTRARLHVANLGLDHITLGGVSLGDGLELGEVEIEAGLSLLWRRRADVVTVRGARVSAAALERFVHHADVGAGAGTRSPFDTLRLERCVVAFGASQVALRGTVSLDTAVPELDLEARSAAVRVDRVTIRDLDARVHDSDGHIRVCAAGQVERAKVEACSTLPSIKLAELEALEVAWKARAPSGSASSGRGRLSWAGGHLEISGVHAEISLATQAFAGATVAKATISADLAGSVSNLDFDVRGDARAEEVVLGDDRSRATLRAVHVPFAVHVSAGDGGLQMAATEPLVARASEAVLDAAGTRLIAIRPGITVPAAAARAVIRSTGVSVTRGGPHLMSWQADEMRWQGARVRQPSGTYVRRARVLQWHARQARWSGMRLDELRGSIDLDLSRGTHALAWGAVTGPGDLAAGQGELAVRIEQGRLHLERGNIAALGGVLSVVPAVTRLDAPLTLVLRARSIQLARLLDATSRGRLEGTGALDGEIALGVDRSGWSVTGGSLRARSAGTLRVSDAGVRQWFSSPPDFAVHRRIAGALADFRYQALAAVFHPHGPGPELQLTVRGRGVHVPQDLDLVFNVRGVTRFVRRIAASR